MRLLCNTSGRSSHDEIGWIEATITSILLPTDEKKLHALLEATGRVVADNLMSSGYQLLDGVSLIRV